LQHPTLRDAFAVILGAIPGALSRYYVGVWFLQQFGSDFPYGTFVINLTGCFGMGFFFTLATERVVPLPQEIRLLVAVGFLGSYTTFSTYALDAVALIQAQRWLSVGGYWLGSAVLGLVGIQAGQWLGHSLNRWIR
jgi:CrcB protein